MKKKNPPEPVDSSSLETYLIGSLVAVIAFLIGFFKIANTDIWWHLKAGELFLERGLIRQDIFSLSATGNHWVIHEWLAEIILYLTYKAGGIVGLMLYKGVISTAIALIILTFGLKKGRNLYLSASLAILAVAGMSFMMYARPHSLSFLFLAMELSLLFGDFSDVNKTWRARWIYLPLLFLIWANIHAGFILGLGIYWIVTLYHLLAPKPTQNKGSKVKLYLLPVVFASLICLVNPNFHEIYTYIFVILGNPLFKQTIAEWVSPIYLGKGEWLAISILVFCSLIGLTMSILAFRKRPDITLIVVATGISAWTARRNIQNFAIVVPMAVLAIQLPKPKSIRRALGVLNSYAFVPALIFIALLFFAVHDYQKTSGRGGIGIVDNLNPLGAAKFLQDEGFEGRLLNVLGDGGYLIWAGWPRWQVFIDGRLDIYGQEFVANYRRIVDGAPGAMAAMEQYDIDGAVLPFPPMIGNIRTQLATSPDWALVYFDDNYLVFIKRNGKNDRIIEKSAFHYLNPLKSGFGIDDPALADKYLAEAERNLAQNPRSALANLIMAVIKLKQNEHRTAAIFFKKAIEYKPALAANYSGNVAQAYFQAGDLDSAAVWYRKAVGYRPTARAFYELGVIMLRKGDRPEAEKYFRRSLELDPRSPAREMLGK